MLMRDNIMYTEKAGIRIAKNENKYGLISDSETILSMEYDNIFIYGMYLYVLHKGGKIGAIQFNDTDLSYKVIADTKYDTLDFYWHDLLFSDGKEFVYYFCDADHYGHESTRILTSVRIEENAPLIYASDNENYYIFKQGIGEMLWKEEKGQSFMISEPCYLCCGNINGNPMFYDVPHGDFITPEDDGYRRHKKFQITSPVIVNGKNILTVIEDGEKFGLLDVRHFNCVIPKYDKIEFALTVKSEKNGANSVREYKLFSTEEDLYAKYLSRN